LQLWQRSARIAAGLRELGVRPARPVVLLIEDTVDFVPAFWACVRGGFLPVPLQTAARDALHKNGAVALLDALANLDGPVILADGHFERLAATLGREKEIPVISLASTEAGMARWSDDAPPADPVCLVATSGSTGRLKLVALGPRAILYRTFAAHQPAFKTAHDYLGTFPIDSITGYLLLFPRFRSWTQISPSILTAKPSVLLDAIEQFHITALSLTSSMVNSVIAAAEKTERRWNLSSLRHVGLGGETVVRDLMRHLGKFLVRHGASADIIRAGYGTTETGSLVNGANPLAPGTDDHGAVPLGDCAPGVGLRIVGDNGVTLAEGEIGEVEVDCPQKLFTCYWGEPEASRACFTADGWWRTGDLGRLQNGELTLHGRSKEVLIIHGRKFSLADIDAELETVLAAGERAFSCAIHWPEEATERLALVFVTPDPRPDRPAELADELRHAIARRFGILPNPIVAASPGDIPLTAAGKLRRPELAGLVRSGKFDAAEPSPLSPISPPQPGAAVETKLAEIWREVLNIEGELDRGAGFFDLGGDSLRSVMLQTAIEEQFAKRISAEDFFAAPTFDTLLSLVTQNDAGSAPSERASDVALPWPLPLDLRNRLLAYFETWDGERPTRDRLVAGLNMTGTKTPLFWVFQTASELCQLGKSLGADQPLYGFRSGYELIAYKEDEIQTLALRYVSEIIELCPDGPLFIGGNCQGSIIALAMAQHLLRRRRHVPLLMLMETGGMPFQSYPGPVFLLHGRDSIYGNPYKNFRNPDSAWRRAFPDYAVAEVPGAYARIFGDATIDALATTLAQRMQKAESLSPRLIPKLAHRAELSADDIPASMVCGDCRKITVQIRNASPVIWRAGNESGLMLGNRWLDETGAFLEKMDGRVPLPELAPGAQIQLSLPITAPRQAGNMQLIVDVAEEGHAWFNPPQNAALRAQVKIVGE
jgi:acyl-CoA synthetase (AMP-forming)/AMP-acid ligase II/acyl carrier protein